jgi:hypothetical protein
MPPKRKAGSALEVDNATQKKIKGQPPSNLIPAGERTKAVKGVKNVDMLRMLCIDRTTQKHKELHFKKLVHAEIDWDDAEHIAKINSWRNQLYGRAGLKAKDVCMWDPEEEAWLELYFHLIIVQGTKDGLMIPRAKDVLDDFNAFFMGRVFTNKRSEEQEPRKARHHNAFVSKMNRVVQHLKTRLEFMMLGKSGDYYRPVVTQSMLDQYVVLKDELKASKVMNKGEYVNWQVDFEAGDEWANNEHWEKFWKGVLDLPAFAKQEAEDLDAELDEKLIELNVDMDELHHAKEEDSSDSGKDALLSLLVEPADTDVESNAGNESTLLEGDTGITEPDHSVEGVAIVKATSSLGAVVMDTDKINLEQVRDASPTKVDVAMVGALPADNDSEGTLVGDESEGKDRRSQSTVSVQHMLTKL